MNVPITLSCISVDFEYPIVFRLNRFKRVLMVKFALSMRFV
ncbi:hypothetical protein BTN49_1403 [Candidatus Enterovibrio escicola]|uniref:Uncharacterized protein n=1 Tax=Candidatus Enterovibrio escicola TaxID=1927127 RepID=A0A2A5T3W8_9GAMM|nr:hypothetical protein BTN49_1403 [Candidatus Enterovibrio escacola]